MRSRVEITLKPGQEKLRRPVRRLVRSVLKAEGALGSVIVAFVDESEISAMNEHYRESEGPTDVLSFRQADSDTLWPDPNREEAAGLGELAVCLPIVRRYALDEGGDPETQLGWTVLHGVLHLLGYDHETDGGEMRAREQELLERLDAQIRAVSKELKG